MIEALLGLARTSEDRAAVRPLLERVLALAHGEARRLSRAEALATLALEFEGADGERRLAHLREVVTLREAASPPTDWELADARRTLAWFAYLAGDEDEAYAQLRKRLADLPRPACAPACADQADWSYNQALADLGWALLDGDRGAEALALLPSAPEAGDVTALLAAWAHHAAGEPSRARSLLDARLAAKLRRAPLLQTELEIDRALFAAAAGDEGPGRELAATLATRLAAASTTRPRFSLAWLRDAARRDYDWQRSRYAAERAWLEAHAPAALEPAPPR